MDFILNNLMYVVLAAVSGGMLLWNIFSGGGASQISPREATLLINREDALVIDVRGDAEWTAGHIANARHMTIDQVDKQWAEIEKFKARPVIINCHSGVRSRLACSKLKKHGFEKVFNLSGGIVAWRDAGLPITTK